MSSFATRTEDTRDDWQTPSHIVEALGSFDLDPCDHGDGIALIPPRVGSIWFHEEVLEKCDAMLFMKGRVSFLDGRLKPVAGNNADSVLIAFGLYNSAMLSSCGIPGKFWMVRA